MSEIEDIINAASKRMAEEEAADAAAPLPVEPAATPEEVKESLLKVIGEGLLRKWTALLYIDDDPHVQLVRCSQGHIMGAVSLLSRIIVLQIGSKIACIVCGEQCDTPDYVPVGDEDPDIIAAIQERDRLAKEHKANGPEAPSTGE